MQRQSMAQLHRQQTIFFSWQVHCVYYVVVFRCSMSVQVARRRAVCHFARRLCIWVQGTLLYRTRQKYRTVARVTMISVTQETRLILRGTCTLLLCFFVSMVQKYARKKIYILIWFLTDSRLTYGMKTNWSLFYSYIAGSLNVSGPQAHLQEISYSCSHNHWFSICAALFACAVCCHT